MAGEDQKLEENNKKKVAAPRNPCAASKFLLTNFQTKIFNFRWFLGHFCRTTTHYYLKYEI